MRVEGDGRLAAALLADVWVVDDLSSLAEGFAGVAVTRDGRVWSPAIRELRQVPAGGEDRVLAERNRRDALLAEVERAARAEQAALAKVEEASRAVQVADAARDEADRAARAAARARDEAAEAERHAGWLIEQRRSAPDEGPAAERRAQVESALASERRLIERTERERADRERRIASERERLARDEALLPAAERLAAALAAAAEAVGERLTALEAELRADREAGERLAAELRACAAEESQVQARLKERGEEVTRGEVRAQQARDRAADAGRELARLAAKLGLEAEPADEALDEGARADLEGRIERLRRRREQLGPVNPLAKREYEEAVAHVEELETQREDLETAMRELESLIRDTDRRIREAFEETFTAAARNFEEVAEQLFPGGRGRLRLVREEGPRPVLGGGDAESESPEDAELAAEAEEEDEDDRTGVEIEITPAGKATKRLTLLSGGEKSLTALAFLFAVFLARPCPFYILDEVEAALDDLNIDRFLTLLRRFADRAQFIVVTHQKRTMEAADCLYGVSMAGNGVSKVVSRRLPRARGGPRGLTAATTRRHRLRAQRLAGAPPAAPHEIVRALVGIQAQDRAASLLALRARGADVSAETSEAPPTRRRARRRSRPPVERSLSAGGPIVRMWAMRGTLHLVAAEDLPLMLAIFAPLHLARGQRRLTELGLPPDLAERSTEETAAILAEDGPLTRHELAARLRDRGVPVDARGQAPIHVVRRAALAGVLCEVGVRGREELYGAIDPGPLPDRDTALVELARRYAAAHAPATREDFAAWSGLPAADVRGAWAEPDPPAGDPPAGPLRLLAGVRRVAARLGLARPGRRRPSTPAASRRAAASSGRSRSPTAESSPPGASTAAPGGSSSTPSAGCRGARWKPRSPTSAPSWASSSVCEWRRRRTSTAAGWGGGESPARPGSAAWHHAVRQYRRNPGHAT